MKIYTRAGDEGLTGLPGGQRLGKDAPIFDLLGTIDELNSSLGVTLTHPLPPLVETGLNRVQSLLFDAGAAIVQRASQIDWKAETEALEGEIDTMAEALPPLRNFILPGGSPPAAWLHVARSVARRAERSATAVAESAELRPFLNRLSDWLFCAARFVNAEARR